MQLDGLVTPKALISLNGAFLPLGGLAGKLFSPAAQLLAGIGFAPQLLARLAGDQGAIDRLLAGTGSTIDRAGRQAGLSCRQGEAHDPQEAPPGRPAYT
jgi:magnesium chelatase accessory protein